MRDPVLVIISGGRNLQSYVGRESDEFTVNAEFTKDSPDGEIEYNWITFPEDILEFTDERFPWKRKFKIKGEGILYIEAKDENGFKLESTSVNVKLSNQKLSEGDAWV